MPLLDSPWKNLLLGLASVNNPNLLNMVMDSQQRKIDNERQKGMDEYRYNLDLNNQAIQDEERKRQRKIDDFKFSLLQNQEESRNKLYGLLSMPEESQNFAGSATYGMTPEQRSNELRATAFRAGVDMKDVMPDPKLPDVEFLDLGGSKVPVNKTALQRYMMTTGYTGIPGMGGQSAFPPMLNSMQIQFPKTESPNSPRTDVTINNNKGDDAFVKTFNEKFAGQLVDDYGRAEKSLSVIDGVNRARDLLDRGIYSGSLADFKLGFGKAMKLAGMNYADNEIENTEAYVSVMGQQVLDNIKQLGAGSAISNADVKFMENVVGKNIGLDEKSMRRILDISDQVSRQTIKNFQKKAGNVKSKDYYKDLPVSLDIAEPPAYKRKSGNNVDSLVEKYRTR